MTHRTSLHSINGSEFSIESSHGQNMYVLPVKPLASNILSQRNHEALMDKPHLSGRRYSGSLPPLTSLKDLIPSSSTKISEIESTPELWDQPFLSCSKP